MPRCVMQAGHGCGAKSEKIQKRKNTGNPHLQFERLFPDRFQLFGHRRAPHREWFSSRLLDAGRDHGEGLHLEPAGNIEAGKKLKIVGHIIWIAMQL